MKKLIAIIPLVLVLQLPICPYSFLPQDWVSSYEYGKRWAQLLMKLYALSFADSQEGAANDQPQTPLKSAVLGSALIPPRLQIASQPRPNPVIHAEIPHSIPVEIQKPSAIQCEVLLRKLDHQHLEDRIRESVKIHLPYLQQVSRRVAIQVES